MPTSWHDVSKQHGSKYEAGILRQENVVAVKDIKYSLLQSSTVHQLYLVGGVAVS